MTDENNFPATSEGEKEEEMLLETFEKEDEFGRKEIAEKILKLIVSDIEVSPLLIEGYWGTGKTRFCKKLGNLLKKEHPNYQYLYIDAFKEDHGEDPLLMLLANIVELLKENPKKKAALEKLKSLSVALGKLSMKCIGKVLIAYLFKQNPTLFNEEVKKILEESAYSAFDVTVDSLVADYKETQKSMETLKEALAEIVKDNPLVLVVDELDRCRPDFAISILEKIKHVFDIDNVFFILVANKKQLNASIKHFYGDCIETERYLDKFIKLTITIPPLVLNHYSGSNLASVQYLKLLILKDDVIKSLYSKGFESIVSCVFMKRKTTLREVETFVRLMKIVFVMSPVASSFDKSSVNLFSFILAGYCSCFYSEIAEEILRGNIQSEKIIETFNTSDSFPGKKELMNLIKAFEYHDSNASYLSGGALWIKLLATRHYNSDLKNELMEIKEIFIDYFRTFNLISIE